jgi:hypothetical protein
MSLQILKMKIFDTPTFVNLFKKCACNLNNENVTMRQFCDDISDLNLTFVKLETYLEGLYQDENASRPEFCA